MHQLRTVVKPLVGNLFEMHEFWLRDEETDLQPGAPLMNFGLVAWEEERSGKDNIVRYAVQDVTPL